MNKEIVAFKRRKVIVSGTELVDPRNLEDPRNQALVTLIKELKKLGFYLSSEVMCKISVGEMKRVYDTVLPYIYKEVLHGGKKFKPLYPGFPKQVIEKSELDLWDDIDRVYSGDLEGFIKDNPWRTASEKKKIENDPTKELTLITPDEFMDIPQQIMGSGNSLTLDTMEELEWFLREYPGLKIPERIPFKETLCLVASIVPEKVEMKEVNDVLRYGIFSLGGSPELPNVPKEINENSWSRNKTINPEWRNLKPFPRSKRKEICERLEKIIESKGLGKCVADAKQFYGHWILLSERLHPGEYHLRFPETSRFFHSLKSHQLSKQYKTFGGELQKMYDEEKNSVELAEFLSHRPGELVRKLDSLLRRAYNEGNTDKVLDIFFDTQGMKNKTLLELLSYYDRRNNTDIPRLIKDKSTGATTKLKPLKKFPEVLIETVQDVITRKVFGNIVSRVQEKDLDGKVVYIDPEIKKIPIPKAMRSQSVSIPAGTRLKLTKGKNGKNIVRFFVHWIQKDKSEDLDLHAFLWKSPDSARSIGWNSSLKDDDQVAVHSGDVLNRPGDCAEYVDIDLDKAKSTGVKFVVADIMNYIGRGLDSLPCWVGYLHMNHLQANNRDWFPKNNVELSVKMLCKASSVAAFLVDVEKSEIMILDCPMNGIPVIHSGNFDQQTSIIQFFGQTQLKYSSFDILEQYYTARGAVVVTELPDQEEEDKIVDEKVTFQEISSDYVKVLSIIGE